MRMTPPISTCGACRRRCRSGVATVDGSPVVGACAEAIARRAGACVALWGSTAAAAGDGFVGVRRVRAAEGLRLARTAAAPTAPAYPDLSRTLPCADAHAARGGRPARACSAEGAEDQRAVARPRRVAGRLLPAAARCRPAAGVRERCRSDYAFVRVEGDGVHEIPVGPVHAGIIEPGPLPLLGRRREGAAAGAAPGLRAQGHRTTLHRTAAVEAHRLAGRVSGDSTVAYAWAYAWRWRPLTGCAIPARAPGCARCCSSASAWPTTSATSARSATTAALAFGLAQFSRLREEWQRASEAASATA